MPSKGTRHTEEARRKISETLKKLFEDTTKTPMFGKKHSAKTRAKMSESARGRKHSAEAKVKMSETVKKKYEDPTKHPNWQGGKSFEPYCPRFDLELKERIRNRDERKCRLCGKSEILNGRRLAVHHIDANKMQGCDGKKWYLAALCHACNTRASHNLHLYEFSIVINRPYMRGGTHE